MCNAIYRWYEQYIKECNTLEELEGIYDGSKKIKFPLKWELRLYDLYRKRKCELEE